MTFAEAPAAAPGAAPRGTARPPRRSLAMAVVEALTERIRLKQYKPGEKLPTEPVLMADLGVSRTVIREAMSRLQAAGLVETKHGIGTFVLAHQPGVTLDRNAILTIRDVMAMMELRISLETEGAALAAQRRTDADLMHMRKALDDFEAALAAGEKGVPADYQFHLQIALATQNPYFESVFRSLGGFATTIIPRTRLDTMHIASEPGSPFFLRTFREHQDILDAILRRDADSARASMRLHIANSRERLRRATELAEAEDGEV
jgi:DNA-binding FadR family transcriptional regulator